MTPNRQDFQKCLDIILEIARNNNLSSIDVKASEIHRLVGHYPNQGDHRIPVCCSVMRDTMKETNKELPNSLKNDGATMTIRYSFITLT